MTDRTVMMFLANAYRPDTRVEKEAATLSEAGFPVTIVAWDRAAELLPEEDQGHIRIQRIQNVRTKYGGGIRQVFYTPRFWREAIKIGLQNKPGIVHCHDLDTLYIGVHLKQKLGCSLVYDAHEDYPTLMSLYLPAFAARMLVFWERFLMRHADAVVTASTVLADKYKAAGFANISILPNVQNLALFDRVTQTQVDNARQKIGADLEDLNITYIGGFSRNRLLLPLIEAVKSLKDTNLYLFGDGHQKEEIEKAVQATTNCHYLGWLHPNEIPIYMELSDVVYYCLKPDYPGAVFNSPNTLAHAMASGRPIIANNIGDLGGMVSLANCGVLLEKVDPESIRSAIKMLRDREFRVRLGQNGRRFAEREYNWTIASQRLVNAYQGL